jgi:hypothetical protein
MLRFGISRWPRVGRLSGKGQHRLLKNVHTSSARTESFGPQNTQTDGYCSNTVLWLVRSAGRIGAAGLRTFNLPGAELHPADSYVSLNVGQVLHGDVEGDQPQRPKCDPPHVFSCRQGIAFPITH